MPADRHARSGRGASVLLLTALLAVAACSDDDGDNDEPEALEPTTESTEPIMIEVTSPLELSASLDPDFIDDVLADDVVTAEEIEDAYARFVDCLGEGGAAGIYAFDWSLRVAFADWSMADAGAGDNEEAVLGESCSRDFLGDLIPRYDEANPPGDDLAERQHESVVACVRDVDPAVAARIPDFSPPDTTGGGVPPFGIEDDAVSLEAEPDDAVEIDRCIATVGVAWTAFG